MGLGEVRSQGGIWLLGRSEGPVMRCEGRVIGVNGGGFVESQWLSCLTQSWKVSFYADGRCTRGGGD